MTNLSDTLKEVESEFEAEQKQRAAAGTKKREDQPLLKHLTKEQWEVLHSELAAKANLADPSIYHASGLI